MPYSRRDRDLDAAQRMHRSEWRLDALDWNAAPDLPEARFELACRLAAQSSYAEEAGMLIAAKLCRLIDDRDLRRLMAQQALEEARHSEAFERYARQRAGAVAAPSPYIDGLLHTLESIEDPHRLFVVHTMFEGMALDQFSFLRDAYEDDLLGDIYRLVRGDEANHVSMGIHFLKRALPALHPDDVRELDHWCTSTLPHLVGIPGVVALIEIAAPAGRGADVTPLLQSRFDNRLQQMFSTSSRKATP